MFAELMAFFAALKEISSTLKLLTEEVKQMRRDAIDSALSDIKKDVNDTLSKIQSAQTKEDRLRLAVELNSRLSK